MLFFLYPRFRSGEINPWLFQATIVVMGFATFSFVFSSFQYYCASLCTRFDEIERSRYSRRADRLWLVGYLFEIRHYPKIETMLKMAGRAGGGEPDRRG